MGALRDAARGVLKATGLAHWRYRYHEWAQSRTDDPPPEVDENGLPIPSAYLMYLIGGTTNWRFFLKSGEEAVNTFADAVERAGGDFRGASRILDLGCGCGRLARHIPKRSGATLYGVDYNPRLVRWCAKNLPGVYARNRLQPPLDFPGARFDVAYLLSVFTHLRIDTQNAWLAELARVIRPGGFALVTFHDESHDRLSWVDITPERLVEEGAIVCNDASEGSNLISTFQSRAQAEAQFSAHFDVAEIIDSQATPIKQAIAVLKRRA
ncbi:MAG: class I SAM-dependent methyltransferase [Pseudomonadota bacterium]